MQAVVQDLETMRIKDSIQMTPFDIGWNQCLDAVIARLNQYNFKERCLFCGSPIDDNDYGACDKCGFPGWTQ